MESEVPAEEAAEEASPSPQGESEMTAKKEPQVPTIKVPAGDKRPRGRPKKEPEAAPEPPRPRGRPKKPQVPEGQPEPPVPAVDKRPRGRPPKKEPEAPPPPPAPPQKRPRRAPREPPQAQEAPDTVPMLPPHVLLAQLMAQARQADSESRTGRYRQLVSSWAAV